MLPKPRNETVADFRGQPCAISHRIASVGVDQMDDGRLMPLIVKIGFDDPDILHIRRPSYGYVNECRAIRSPAQRSLGFHSPPVVRTVLPEF
jgi:hypothetical protein